MPKYHNPEITLDDDMRWYVDFGCDVPFPSFLHSGSWEDYSDRYLQYYNFVQLFRDHEGMYSFAFGTVFDDNTEIDEESMQIVPEERVHELIEFFNKHPEVTRND